MGKFVSYDLDPFDKAFELAFFRRSFCGAHITASIPEKIAS
jgi:hypothetical protein